tara:strand:+ start:675 stop:947 length:273 start_codon:yes stop_codon:yes gene_type:complete
MNKQENLFLAGSVLKYVKDNDWELKHSVDALSYAAIKTANLFSDIEPMEVVRFMLGDIPIKGHFTHSYGFHTRNGRAIREFFGTKYYEYE